MMISEEGADRQTIQSARSGRRISTGSRKIIGICIVAVIAVAVVLGGVHSALEVMEASATPASPAVGEYAPRLAGEPKDDPATAALRYVCLFH